MIKATQQWAATAMAASLKQEDAGSFTGVATDTRDLKAGELFFCLQGQRDGHDFAEQAAQKGAAALVIEKSYEAKLRQAVPKTALLSVPNTLKALGDLAMAWRKKFSIPILAITGSHGKTTTKELAKTLLSRFFKVHATQGNFNNLIGVPKTLFGLNKKHQVALVEMGMNDFGEIARLSEISQPTAGLITRIAPAHLEKLKNIAGVAQAKGELFAALSPEASALVNLRDPWIAQLDSPAAKVPYGTVESGLWGEAKVSYQKGQLGTEFVIHTTRLRAAGCGLRETSDKEQGTRDNEQRSHLALIGSHHLDNVLSALALGRHMGIAIEAGLEALKKFKGSAGRMEVLELGQGRLLLNDAYNANQESVTAALKTLQEISGGQKSLAILGAMAELGEASQKAHSKIGQAAAQLGVDFLISLGPQGQWIAQGASQAGMPSSQQENFKSVQEALSLKGDFFKNFNYILVKGSRVNQLEKLIPNIKS